MGLWVWYFHRPKCCWRGSNVFANRSALNKNITSKFKGIILGGSLGLGFGKEGFFYMEELGLDVGYDK